MEIRLINNEDSERANTLLKEATSFKKTNIDKAISLIKEAMVLMNDDAFSMTYKLASYYHIGGYKKEAFSTLESVLLTLDFEDIGMYNMNRSSIFSHISTLQVKDKLLIDNIKTNCLSYYNRLLGFACQGRMSEFSSFSAREISISPKVDSQVSSHIASILPTLKEVLCMANETDSDKELFRTGEGSIGQIFNNHLRNNQAFMSCYRKLNDGSFENLINQSLI